MEARAAAKGSFSLAVLRDFREEEWPSMDLVADMLVAQLPHVSCPPVVAELLPDYRRVFTRVPLAGTSGSARNADRLLNRMWSYPRAVRRSRADYDAWHVCDHSYGQLVHELPAERTGVFVHDLDTFRCLFDPAESRPGWFRRMARRILSGVTRAALVFHSTQEVRRQIVERGLIDPARLVHAPYGVSPDFSPDASPNDDKTARFPAGPFALHVGSCIARKRIDVLLGVFARLRTRRPELALVQVGGAWTAEQQQLLDRLSLRGAVEQLPRLTQRELAPFYRRAAVVLQPSEAEGFGLPVAEALACASPVVASDLPVLREVGGEAVIYAPLGNLDAWTTAVERVLDSPEQSPSRSVRLAQAAKYSWANHARIIAEAYRELVERQGARRG
jgi:glycosyltransferase involved in cell wall biosynthesis